LVSRGVELDERLRPEDARVQLILDKTSDVRVADLEKAPGIGGVVVDQAAAEVENVHGVPRTRTVGE